MISVMFDSNVYQCILDPKSCKIPPYKENFIQNCEIINAGLKNKKIEGYLSEVIYQMEAIDKNKRKDFFKNNKSHTVIKQEIMEDGTIRLSISIGENYNVFPMDQYRNKYINLASSLGFKIIRNSRIGFPKTLIPEDMFLKIASEEEFHKKNNKKGKVLQAIEQRMAGMSQIKKTSATNAPKEKLCFAGLNKCEDKDENKISKEFSEWADGDAIATCGGYDIDYFCTEDCGKKAGTSSILGKDNKKWLKEQFGINIINIKELVDFFD